MSVNEWVCKNISLQTDSGLILDVEDRWAGDEGRNLLHYNKKSEDFGVEIFYETPVIISGKKDFPVCVLAKKYGTFYGAVLFSSDNFGVGNWVVVNCKKDLSSWKSLILGRVVDAGREERSERGLLVFLVGVFLLLIVLLVLVWWVV